VQLSNRLLAVASLASAGHCLADVGTDHGYIPIYLIEEGKYETAIAMDVNEGPLQRALENRNLHGMQEKIALRLSDGVYALQENEADTVVIAGMGGGLVMKILSEGKNVLETVETLVLQPQSELTKVREFLENHTYYIEAENMILEDGKYYPMMRVKHGKADSMDELEKKYGPCLLKEKHPCLLQYLEQEEKVCQSILQNLQSGTGEKAKARMLELEEELHSIKMAKERMR